jgi:tetratricopeptide (TPR) repeat protein
LSSSGPLPRWVLPGSIAALIAGLYLPFLGVPFEYDDKVEILANQVIREPGNITELLRYNPFRLLLMWTFAADLWAWGARPEGYRAVNVLIHLANSLMVMSLLRRLGSHWKVEQHALFVASGALLFAGHPLAIESVTYISGRSSSLATCFVLASLIYYCRYAELLNSPGPLGAQLQAATSRSARWVALVLGAGLAASIPVAWGVRSGEFTLAGTVPTLITVIGCVVVLAAVLSKQRGDTTEKATQEFHLVRKRAGFFYAASMTSFLLGCLCKEIAATAPALLLLAEWLVWQKSWRGALKRLSDRLLPFFGVPLMLIVLRVVAYGYVASPTFLRPWTDNLLTEVEVVVQYIKLWLLPFPLSIYHEYPVVSPPGTVLTWLSAALLMALLGLALRSQRRAPALCFGLLAAALTLAPTSSIFALKETMAEHRTYLPSLGYAFVCAWCFGGPVARRVGPRLAGLILMAVVLGNSVLHHSYQRLWSNEEVLWSHAVRVNPNASDAWRYLGDLYLGQGRMEDSERAFEKAVGTRPTSAEALTKLGLVRAHRGDLDAGHELFTRALEAANCYSPALNNLALVQRRRKDVHSAIDIYHRSLLCKVDNYRAHIGLGDIYYGEVKNREKAAEHYGFALQFMDPMHPDAAMIKTRLLELTW